MAYEWLTTAKMDQALGLGDTAPWRVQDGCLIHTALPKNWLSDTYFLNLLRSTGAKHILLPVQVGWNHFVMMKKTLMPSGVLTSETRETRTDGCCGDHAIAHVYEAVAEVTGKPQSFTKATASSQELRKATNTFVPTAVVAEINGGRLYAINDLIDVFSAWADTQGLTDAARAKAWDHTWASLEAGQPFTPETLKANLNQNASSFWADQGRSRAQELAEKGVKLKVDVSAQSDVAPRVVRAGSGG